MRNSLMPFQGPRLLIFRIAMLLVFLGLVARLYYYQFTKYDEFNAAANENAVQSVPLPAPRGVIYDRYGTDLARNDASFNVGIIPAALPDNPDATFQVYNRLSALLALGNIQIPATRAIAVSLGKSIKSSLEDLVSVGAGIAPYRTVIVATDVDRQVAQMILEDDQSLPGVTVDRGPVRQYPSGAFTADIIGYLGPISAQEAEALRQQGYNPAFERVGYAGIEAYLDDQLSGKRGLETREVDVAGQAVRILKRDEPIPGQNVRLTIDLDLQKAVYRALETQINHINDTCDDDPKLRHCDITQSGVVILENPQTGEILSMVSFPTYDNSRFARSIDADYYFSIKDKPQFPFINHAVSSLYPPGSTWKMITGSSVVQQDVIASTTFLNDPGRIQVSNSLGKLANTTKQTFVCWYRAGHGQVDLVHAISWSCDVYFYQVGGGYPDKVSENSLRGEGLGITDLDRYATAFGIGVKSGIELPAEVAGRLPDPTWKRRVYSESWGTGDTYNAAFGQGYITVTPLQLVNAAASIANGGTLYQPTLIDGYADSAGNLLQPFQPKVERTILYPTSGSAVVLNMREDMYLQGKNSLICVCEQNSDKCTNDFMQNYTATFTLKHLPHVRSVDYHANDKDQQINYKVFVPLNYNFDTFPPVCDPLQYGPNSEHANYQPPFIDAPNLQIVRDGMHGAVTDTGGTVNIVTSNDEHQRLTAIGMAGKTGTAEYCDNLALGKNLCIPGSWPSHAWFVGFAPYENPQVVAVAFIYNAGEGSLHAYPVVQYAIDCYNQLQLERAHGETPKCKDYTPPIRQ